MVDGDNEGKALPERIDLFERIDLWVCKTARLFSDSNALPPELPIRCANGFRLHTLQSSQCFLRFAHPHPRK